MGEEKRTLSCTDCGVLNCHKRNASVSGVLFDRKADRRRHRRNDSAL